MAVWPIVNILCRECGAQNTLSISVDVWDSISARARSTDLSTGEDPVVVNVLKRTAARTRRDSSPEKENSKTTPSLDALPVRAARMAKASVYKRGIAIAHQCLDDEPDVSSAVERFKQRCIAQGLDYAARGPDGRPLYARVFDWVEQQRARRRAR